MAVRDRNLFAWQAYVITMAFVSMGLLLGMFFLWRSYSDLSTRFADTSDQLTTARNEAATSDQRVERLKSMLGYGEYTEEDLKRMQEQFVNDPEMSEVEADFAQQMALFDPNATEKNLLKLPQYLLGTIRLRNEQIAQARDREQKLQADMTATVQRERAARDDALNKQKKAEADLEATRQQFAAASKELNDQKDAALQKFDQYRQLKDRELAVVVNERDRLKADNTKQAETIAVQMDVINQYRHPDFASPQGEIVRVADGGTSVWINLGSDDGLREGVPFSVIDESAVNITEADPKANLVVTRVVAERLCRAKVTNYDYRSTIVPGDKIYSPAWRPGRQVGFALVGMMDINADGKDDIEQVRELIRLSGGRVDAEMDAKGAVRSDGSRKMSPNTSFLVLGTDLGLSEGSLGPDANEDLMAAQKDKAASYAKFMAEARQNGIIQISLDKLMGYLKIEGSDRTVPLGGRIQAKDFPIRSSVPPPSSRGSVSEIFMPRSPK